MKRTYYLILGLLLILALSLAACGGGSASSGASDQGESSAPAEAAQASAGDAEAGKELFSGTCSACHGPAGEGVPGLGKDMTQSDFIAGKSDQELVEFIKEGRDPSHPLNTTGVAMPPKGGNPALSDGDLLDIVAYVRSLQK